MLAYVFTKNGWLTRTSQFSTDQALAKEFSIADAIVTCARFKSNGVMAVPVRQEDMENIK